MTMVEKTLVPAKDYLQTGAHIGAKFKSEGMRRYIYKNRRDKLKVLDVSTIDDRIRMAAKFLASFEPERIVIVSQKEYGQTPAKRFAKIAGLNALLGRFVPGTFTNPESERFIEPTILVVTDPNSDKQAIKEASKMKIPVIGLCSTDNQTKNIDLILPINNKGRRSLALLYWLLAREYMKETGKIKSSSEFTDKLEDYEFQIDEKAQAKKQAAQDNNNSRFRGRKFGKRR